MNFSFRTKSVQSTAILLGVLLTVSCAKAQTLTANLTDPSYSPVPGKLVVFGMMVGSPADSDLVPQVPPAAENQGFVQVLGHARCWGALRADGSVIGGGDLFAPPILSEVEGKITRMAVGHQMTGAIDDRGRGYIWESGIPSSVKPLSPLVDLVDIRVGENHGVALTRSGRLLSWGNESLVSDEFRARITPFQGRITAIRATGSGGALVTQQGSMFHWNLHPRTPLYETLNDLPPLTDPIEISVEGKFRLIKTQSGKILSKVPFQGSKVPTDPLRILLYPFGLALFEMAPREWEVVGGQTPEFTELRTFLDTHRPSALSVFGIRKLPSRQDFNGFGLIAIVPSETTPPPTTITSATPSPSTASQPKLAISDPRFAALLKLYEVEVRANVTAPHEAALSELNAKLETALSREEESAIDAGDLDLVTAFRAERERIGDGEVPATDAAGTPETIQRFRRAWRAEKAKIDTNSAILGAPLRKNFEAKLIALETALTQESKIDEAIKLRKFREQNAPQQAVQKAAPPLTMPAGEKRIAFQLIDAQNSLPGRNKDMKDDVDRDHYVVESNQSRGTLTLSFEYDALNANLTRFKTLTLEMQVAKIRLSDTETLITVSEGNQVVASKKGAKVGELIRFDLPTERFNGRSSIEFLIKCGTDAVIFEKASTPKLEGIPE